MLMYIIDFDFFFLLSLLPDGEWLASCTKHGLRMLVTPWPY